MQNRMKNFQLESKDIDDLLATCHVGTLGTINSTGYPYVLPLHFIYHSGRIYLHGLMKGQKLENIASEPKVSFNAYKMNGYIAAEKACNTNTAFNSVVVVGNASVVDNFDLKQVVLNKIIEKYTPLLTGQPISEKRIKGTCVIEIIPVECTGKYYL